MAEQDKYYVITNKVGEITEEVRTNDVAFAMWAMARGDADEQEIAEEINYG